MNFAKLFHQHKWEYCNVMTEMPDGRVEIEEELRRCKCGRWEIHIEWQDADKWWETTAPNNWNMLRKVIE